ncbi:Probable NAD(P) transhydrogenase, beta subunit PntB [Mycobacteroides abscessus subsp. abscessus]|nr:Probable NAD(P) transhydrogenase, beta subunit PntB [Mycobacteroides abscessus subsp. abscessus]
MSSESLNYIVDVLYIAAFALFIYGLSGLTGPKTAVRGNWIAAVGMGIAVLATLIKVSESATTLDWILIGAGLGIGVVLGIPPALKTKMTAMPQLVALFNGVGGGTVALIAWSEFIETKGFSEFKPDQSPTVALIFGTLNVIGGFLVTDRMLGMFKSKKPAQSEQQKEAAK